jgi:hypothetical protein
MDNTEADDEVSSANINSSEWTLYLWYGRVVECASQIENRSLLFSIKCYFNGY